MLKAAKMQQIKLSLLPTVFERHQANQTSTVPGPDRAQLIWTVEWVFELAAARYIENGHRDDVAIGELLAGFVGLRPDNVVKRHRLKPYVREAPARAPTIPGEGGKGGGEFPGNRCLSRQFFLAPSIESFGVQLVVTRKKWMRNLRCGLHSLLALFDTKILRQNDLCLVRTARYVKPGSADCSHLKVFLFAEGE